MFLDYKHDARLGVIKENNIVFYTCKFSVGQRIYPLINVGGPRVVGERTEILNIKIVHDPVKGLAIEYQCQDGRIYTDESELFALEHEAKAACYGFNRIK